MWSSGSIDVHVSTQNVQWSTFSLSLPLFDPTVNKPANPFDAFNNHRDDHLQNQLYK